MVKRGVTAEVFKYIFVVIAGALILIFFVRFAFQHKTTEEYLISSEITETLKDSFMAFSISQSADKNIDLRYKTKVFINKNFCGTIAVENSNNVEINDIIFSPVELDGSVINVWTQSWKYPFKIGNFFYLSNPSSKIFLIGNSNLARELVNFEGSEYIPKRFNVERRNSVSINEIKKYDNVKLVFFDDIYSSYSNELNKILIEVKENSCDEEKDDIECRGIVKFKDGQSIFIGKSMLYGAIFSDSYKNYECGLNKAFERLKLIVDLYINKVNKLIKADQSNRCRKYSNIKISLINFRAYLDSLNSLSMNDADDIYNKVMQIKIINDEDLGGDQNCAFLF